MFKTCPCCSGKTFIQCCKPFITGKAIPKTAEQLMRSRYTAYTRANIGYIQATQTETAVANFNPLEAKQWAQSCQWLGLKILRTDKGQKEDNAGIVEFVASFKTSGQLHKLQEVSQFIKQDTYWFYTGYKHE